MCGILHSQCIFHTHPSHSDSPHLLRCLPCNALCLCSGRTGRLPPTASPALMSLAATTIALLPATTRPIMSGPCPVSQLRSSFKYLLHTFGNDVGPSRVSWTLSSAPMNWDSRPRRRCCWVRSCRCRPKPLTGNLASACTCLRRDPSRLRQLLPTASSGWWSRTRSCTCPRTSSTFAMPSRCLRQRQHLAHHRVGDQCD